MIAAIDHLVLTVRDVDATVVFYHRVLGMEPVTFGDGRRALRFGSQKINLHECGKELDPKAARPASGSADLCFLLKISVDEMIRHLDLDTPGNRRWLA